VNGLHVTENRSGTGEYFQDHLCSTRLKTDENGNSIYDAIFEPISSDLLKKRVRMDVF